MWKSLENTSGFKYVTAADIFKVKVKQRPHMEQVFDKCRTKMIGIWEPHFLNSGQTPVGKGCGWKEKVSEGKWTLYYICTVHIWKPLGPDLSNFLLWGFLVAALKSSQIRRKKENCASTLQCRYNWAHNAGRHFKSKQALLCKQPQSIGMIRLYWHVYPRCAPSLA